MYVSRPLAEKVSFGGGGLLRGNEKVRKILFDFRRVFILRFSLLFIGALCVGVGSEAELFEEST